MNLKNIDLSLITQAVPSLLISLIGLSLSGKKLDKEQNSKIAASYPLLLLSNCILSFKGNTEVIYAMHLSSLSQTKGLNSKKYLRFSFDNGCLLLVQSIIIGLSVGMFGMGRNVLANVCDFTFFPKMIATCVLTSFTSSLFLILLLIPIMLIAVKAGTNPDNIILPVISSIGDYMDIYILIFFMNRFQGAANLTCILSSLLIISLVPLLVYISVQSPRRIPIQGVYVLISTYILSTGSSYAVQHFSKKHLILAASYPIFCGLTGSCSYIYLNRKVTSLQNETPHNRKQIYITLIFTSFLVSITTALVMPFFGIHFKTLFSFLFISLFIVSVCMLMKIIDLIIVWTATEIDEICALALPTITSFADFLGTIFIIGSCFMVNGI